MDKGYYWVRWPSKEPEVAYRDACGDWTFCGADSTGYTYPDAHLARLGVEVLTGRIELPPWAEKPGEGRRQGEPIVVDTIEQMEALDTSNFLNGYLVLVRNPPGGRPPTYYSFTRNESFERLFLKQPEPKEAKILVDGVELTTAQVKSVRAAVTGMLTDLQNEEHRRELGPIAEKYEERLREVETLLCKLR